MPLPQISWVNEPNCPRAGSPAVGQRGEDCVTSSAAGTVESRWDGKANLRCLKLDHPRGAGPPGSLHHAP